VDDYYLNLLDWSCNNTVRSRQALAVVYVASCFQQPDSCLELQIAVALGRTIYLWNAASGSVEELCSLPGESDYICSVAWSSDGTYLAVGTSDAKVQIWDASRLVCICVHRDVYCYHMQVSAMSTCSADGMTPCLYCCVTNRCKQIRELCGHTNRVSAVAWGGSILSSGGRDSVINCWDVRKRRDEACVARLQAHEQEVGTCVHVKLLNHQPCAVYQSRPVLCSTAPTGLWDEVVTLWPAACQWWQ
jgi:cell division cycle protein 20 (cofactor of APC complex)